MRKKTVLITGASNGIGREYSYFLAEKGYNVILVSRSKSKLDQLAADLIKRYNIDASVIVQDLSEEWAAKHVYEKVTKKNLTVDMLINNAGFGTTGAFLASSETNTHKQVMLNVNAVVNMTQKFLPDMERRGTGAIVNIASTSSFLPIPYMSVYAATKAFVLSFSESLHKEYRGKGIRILAVCPGTTQTDFFDSAPDTITAGGMRTTRQVVRTSYKALIKGKNYVVDGKLNYLISLSPRIFSRKLILRITSTLMRRNIFRSESK
ncbi:SDR family oxidoreductase [Salicibibacter cibarius]|uniref:SDR family oxidoreductase n=1 Tax=Salicibibacter cibarius TaxID=2743000 RepID=A0A7T7CAX6_9BACI|nr:SDR family oxidoreductase [Salicibibacter cibarius]QQK75184.1 SDR family oxidoreductase [Salicibibacter cibarius]